VAYPYARVELAFRDRSGKPTHVDLSRYSAIAFDVKCAPSDTLSLGFLMLQDHVSTPGDYVTYRLPYVYFYCNEGGGRVEIDLARLRTDQWWFDVHKLNLSEQDYTLTKVAKITISDSFQSPFDVTSKVEIKDMALLGRDMRYLYLFAAFMVSAWPAYGVWFFRRHTRVLLAEVKDKVRRDIPLVAYQQLSQEMHRDKEQSAILRFLATEYVNPELDVETMVSKLGISRNKINEILKAELGFTFSTYLNKLRLTEAARLLGEKEETSVAEIAYAVGYRNVSYFNKLFKEEYGCTPKTFRKLRGNTSADAAA
jgi:AraC-like DNA-binding protein